MNRGLTGFCGEFVREEFLSELFGLCGELVGVAGELVVDLAFGGAAFEGDRSDDGRSEVLEGVGADVRVVLLAGVGVGEVDLEVGGGGVGVSASRVGRRTSRPRGTSPPSVTPQSVEVRDHPPSRCLVSPRSR